MAASSCMPRKGHRMGGPLRITTLLLAALALGACGGTSSGPERPAPDGGAGPLRPQQAYRQAGLLAGPDHFPAVASFSTVAGPGDSTYVVFGVSMPNSALRFERDSQGYLGRYEVLLRFNRDDEEVRVVSGSESVRVPAFEETGRTDESIVYQTLIALEPGRYDVEVTVRDAAGSRGFRAKETLEVPAYRADARRLSSPLFVYRAQGRGSPIALPDFILNARRTIAYGGESPLVYVEGYGHPPELPVRLRVLGPDESELWSTSVRLDGGEDGLSHALVEIPAEILPLGRLWLEMAPADADPETGSGERVPLLVTISDQWMVANFDEVLEFLAYIAHPEELDSMREATGEERARLWEEFWERRNPVPASPVNEFRDAFFERIRTASLAFSEAGRSGWQTDRGEVYIVLGGPDHVIERYTEQERFTGKPNVYEWIYERGPMGRMSLIFVDRHGFERYELTPQSRSTFRTAAMRLRERSAQR